MKAMNLPRLHIVDAPPSDLPDRMVTRDAALWIGSLGTATETTVVSAVLLSDLPWTMVLVEDSSSETCHRLAATCARQFERLRGHKIPVASGTKGVSFPARSVPVLFLNGREDAAEAEQRPEALGNLSRTFRRASMLDELVRSGTRVLVVAPGAADSLSELLGDVVEEMRPQVIALAPTASQEAELRQWSETRTGATSVTICRGDLTTLVERIARSIEQRLPSDRLILRIRNSTDGSTQSLDYTDSTSIDSPLFDDFTVLEERHVATVADDSISPEQIDSFFARSGDESSDSYWRPFAAGLPWERDDGSANRRLLTTLSSLHAAPDAEIETLVVESEPGAGGTTAARALALSAARHGYPTLVARTASGQPNAEIVSAFMHAVGQFAQRQPKGSVATDATPALVAPAPFPWLVLFDIEHWQGREEQLPRFIQILRKHGHRVVLMIVRDVSSRSPLPVRFRRVFASPLSHDLSESDVERLGRHINRFLEPVGRAQSLQLWHAFWRDNALIPEPGTMGVQDRVASFWVALEFWLRKQLNLGESIQRWLYRRFLETTYRNTPLSNEARLAILTVAAMSVERVHLPEQLLGPARLDQDPLSVQLEEAAHFVPALGLIKRRSPTGHSWGIAHVPLARHLLEAVSEDSSLLEKLAIEQSTGSVRLRLHLLGLVARSPAMAEDRFRDLAITFAQSILKLDRTGHQEFARYWRDVFNALFAVPDVLWNVSRAFNHHVAISRRRVAVDDELFPDKSPVEKLRLLEDAVSDLEYAVSIDGDEDDESDLNLLNSLARACQDLASLLESSGDETGRVADLRARELACLQQAEHLNPSNSFVLETAARSLLGRAKTEPMNAATHACAALQKISIARRLEGADDRKHRLDVLTENAYGVLSELSPAELSSLRTTSPPLAAMVSAWLLLGQNIEGGDGSLTGPPGPNVEAAILELEAIPARDRDWPLNRLLYDLASLQFPSDFERQLRVLQTLEGTPAMQLQLRLERAILFYLTGAFERGRREFGDVRSALRDSEAIVDVPRRLAWFLRPGTTDRAVCDGRVVRPPPSWNRHAMEIAQLGNSVVVFNPLDFGYPSLPLGNQRKCMIGFNYRGPYAVPPAQDRR